MSRAMTAISPGTTSVIRSAKRRPMVMFIEDASPPAWAVRWCRRSGVEPRIRQTSTRPHHGSPTGLPRSVCDLAGYPVLVVRPSTPDPAPATVTAAIGDLPEDAPVLAAAADAAMAFGARLLLVHGVPPSFAERSVGLEDALDHGGWLLDSAARRVRMRAPGLCVQRRLVRMRPHELVSRASGVVDPPGLLVLGMAPCRPDGEIEPTASSALHYWPSAILFVPTEPLVALEQTP